MVIKVLLGEENNISYHNFKKAELCNICVDEKYCKLRIEKALYKEF